MTPVQRLRACVSRRRFELLGWGLGAFGVVYSVVEAAAFFFTSVAELSASHRHALFLGCFMLAVAAVVWRLWEPVTIALPLRTTNTTVIIKFGDLFAQGTHVAIPVNEYFDGYLGDIVDPQSLHGQFVARQFRSDGDAFEAACDAALASAKTKISSERPRRNRRFAIGATAPIAAGDQKAFLFVLCATDPGTSKARADVAMMWLALEGLWKCVRHAGNGKPISVPLVGAGQSGIGLQPPHLLEIILMSILVATRQGEVAKKISVVLHPDLFGAIDLRSVAQQWA